MHCRHRNWSLEVEIENAYITKVYSEPPSNEDLWPIVRVAWIEYFTGDRRLTEEELEYFIEVKDAL